MVKSANQSRNMGKGNKGKKKDVTAKKANSEVASKVQPSQSGDTSTNSRVNCSLDLICNCCAIRYEESRWFVQCDQCDGYVHFTCAGISVIRDEDPWLCRLCISKANDILRHSVSKEPQKNQPTKTTVAAEVHAILDQSIGMQNENTAAQRGAQCDTIEVMEQTTSEILRSASGHGISSTRVPSSKAQSTVSNTRSTSTNSSARRQQIELQRLEEELKVQNELDAETLALKLEAVKLKASRQKKFLEDKYKALSAGEGSVMSKYTSTEKSSYVSNWVENQRKQNVPAKAKSLDDNFIRSIQRFDDRINRVGFDISIPVDKHELEKIRGPRLTNLEKICETQEYVDNQMKQFMAWRNNRQGETTEIRAFYKTFCLGGKTF